MSESEAAAGDEDDCTFSCQSPVVEVGKAAEHVRVEFSDAILELVALSGVGNSTPFGFLSDSG